MEKRFLQDIKPISRPQGEDEMRGSSQLRRAAPKAVNLPREIPFTPSQPKSSPKHVLWVLAVVCIFVLFFSLSYLFEKAYVNITPKVVPVAFDQTDTFVAKKDSLNNSDLSYTIISLEGDATATAPATNIKPVSDYARGSVTFYNSYSTKSYTIYKGTQLTGPNGLSYKTNSAISIPGYKKTGTTIVPGSADASVTAVQPGELSNIGPVNFSIPSLSKISGKIYASSKGNLSGGVSGMQYSVSQDMLKISYSEAQDRLKSKLMKSEKVQVPDGYLFFDGATVFTSDGLPNIPYSKQQTATFAIHGKLTAYLLKKDPLVNAIVSKFISDYNNEPVTIPKIASLSVVPTNATLDPDNDTTFPFYLSGEAKIVWQIDSKNIQSILSGTKKTDFENQLSKMVGVETASFSTTPFWIQSFPSDPQKINVSVNSVE